MPEGEASRWRDARMVATAWAAIAIGLVGLSFSLYLFGERFGWEIALAEIPAIPLALGGVLAGLIFSSLVLLIPATSRIGQDRSWPVIGLMVLVGLALRLVMIWSTPALEDDFYRYLWDGGVTAHGYNPYALAPDALHGPGIAAPLKDLALQSGAVIERVNHPHIKTIYPPVAQFWFAVAHMMEPWSLLAWRLLGLGMEFVSLGLILALLAQAGRSPLWAALYWWNPVVVKELLNSAHMEVVLLPMILAALWLATARRFVGASVVLALAAGTKLWPVMLLPLFLRPLIAAPVRLAAAILLFGGLCTLWVVPPVLGGIDETSGFVAFARHWQTNSALFQNLNALAANVFDAFGADGEASGLAVRAGLAACVGCVALAMARPAYAGTQDLMVRAAWVVGAQFLLSPVQFPWYATWLFILLPFAPIAGLVAIVVTIPLYYVSFHLAAVGRYDLFNNWVLWLVWVPVWLLLARDALRYWRQPLDWRADA
jgi:alpha-1,6-mannosyltransferase